VANTTTCNVYQLLLAVNKQEVNGALYTGDPKLQTKCADLFNALNNVGSVA
jgi:hypothetical protein